MTFEELAEIAAQCRGGRTVSGFVVTQYGFEMIKSVAVEDELQRMIMGAYRPPMEVVARAIGDVPVRISAIYPPVLGPGEVFLDIGRRITFDPDGC